MLHHYLRMAELFGNPRAFGQAHAQSSKYLVLLAWVRSLSAEAKIINTRIFLANLA